MRAEVRGALLALAEARGGRVTPADVVEAARDPRSPLHEEFDWDDASAAEAHRLARARALLRRVHVVIETHTRSVVLPAFHRAPDARPHEQGYVSVGVLRADEDMARRAVVDAVMRASAALRAARDMADALGLGGEFGEVASRLDALFVAARRAPGVEGRA